MFPITEVRKQFPSLSRTYNGKQVVYFDGPGGTQFLGSAIDAMRDYMITSSANLGAETPTSRETEEMLLKVRQDISTLFNAVECSVAFGANASTMMFHTARALARNWQPGDEIILTELDHHANIDTWRTAAVDKGVTVKYIPLDTKTLTLDFSTLPELITTKTKFIAVGIASNCVGTRTDVRPIVKLAKEVGAVVAIDAVHAIPHFYVDMHSLGVDMLFSSAYKFFTTHVGMAVIRNEIFKELQVYKLAPAPDSFPDCMEIGTQNFEGVAAIPAAIDFIASLGSGETKQSKIISGYEAIEKHEDHLADYIRDELSRLSKVRLYQAAKDVLKTPTISFRVDGMTSRDFCVRICEEYSILIAYGDFYAMTLAKRLGISETGAFIRAGLAPYNTIEEAELFVHAAKKIIG